MGRGWVARAVLGHLSSPGLGRWIPFSPRTPGPSW